MTLSLAQKPPLGWNSWDCYGTAVTEEQVRANAEVMKQRLLDYGWEYIVVDIQWSAPDAKGHSYQPGANLEMDMWGRLFPAPNRFPSAKDGAGFKPLADYVHSLGLKFGIHIMRGIPKQAVLMKTPVLDSNVRAGDIADPQSTCPWNPDMFGVDMQKSGAQAYYDSIFKLYAQWGVDFVKADDMLSPIYHTPELEAMTLAIKRCKREMVLSLSPGGPIVTPALEKHLGEHAQMWRLSDDVWDEWDQVKKQFQVARLWQGRSGPGHWPDLDMLPLGRLAIWKEGPDGWENRLSRDEQKTLMTLWAIFRSPLMMGGDLPCLGQFTHSLLANRDLLEVNQNSRDNRELFQQGDLIVWAAKAQEPGVRYLALFNLGDNAMTFPLLWKEFGLPKPPVMKDIWTGEFLQEKKGAYSVELPPHGTGFYRLS